MQRHLKERHRAGYAESASTGSRENPPGTLLPPFPMKGAPRADESDCLLLADAELANDVRVRLRLHAVEEVEQLPPPTDHGQEAAPAGVVLVMGPHVFRQAVDPGGQDGNLDLRRTGILVIPPMLGNQLLLPLFRNSHWALTIPPRC